MKNEIKAAVLLLLSLLLIFSCDLIGGNSDDTITVESVSISNGSITMTIDSTVQLNAVVLPADAENLNVTWSSSDASIATVSTAGIVTAISEGTVTITVTTTDGGFTASIVITISNADNPEEIPVSSVSLDQKNLELIVNGTSQLTATVLPADADNKSVTWSSSNTDIATVSNAGLVTAVAAGSTTVTVTTADGGYTDSCNITVKLQTVAVTSVSLDKTEISLNVNHSKQLTSLVLPADATDKSVNWSSGDNSIATVSNSGLVTAVSEGIVVITVTTIDGSYSDTCNVKINSPLSFISVWDMSLTDTNILNFPLVEDGNYNFVIDWGDGTVESYTNSNVSHTYDSAAEYTVIVTGLCEGFGFSSSYSEDNEENIVDISQWGSVKLNNKKYKFADCTNLTTFTAMDEPNLEGITNLRQMFDHATSFNGDISGWDTSSVTNMVHMFNNAHVFNQDLSNWDTSNVTSIFCMFYYAEAFNGDISGWDISSITRTAGMFHGADAFNQDISNWDTSNITDMSGMFEYADSFNQDLSKWDTSNVTDMKQMFKHTKAFNGDISGWDTSSVTVMYCMFYGTDAFNGDISEWDTSNVTNMGEMFHDANAFNGDISGWDTSNVTSMPDMFENAGIFTNDDNPTGLESWIINENCNITDMFSGCPLSPLPSWYTP